MKNENIMSVIGVIWLLLWSSYIPHLVYYYPFKELKGVKSLSEEVAKTPDFIKEEAGIGNKNQKELEESVMRELRIIWVKSVSIVIVGLLAAFLMLKKKKGGRIIALYFASGMLLLKIISFLKYWRYQTSPKFWAVSFKQFPVQTIQGIISVIILTMTIILLIRPSADAHLRQKKNEHNNAFNPDAD